MSGPTEAVAGTPRLRIAVVHSFYSSKQPSGENTVVLDQVAALRRAGHTVELYARMTDDLENSRLYPMVAALTVATGHGPAPDLRAFEPDLIHVHNTFPNFGTQWLERAPAPVVSTLHNFRSVCAAGTLYRNGGRCTACVDAHSSKPAVRHGCYRNSRVATIPVALGQRFQHDRLLTMAARVVTVHEGAGRLLAPFIDPQKLDYVPNFLPSGLDPGAGVGGGPWMWAGRLDAQKGLVELLADWPTGEPLLVAGSGALDTQARAVAPDSVRFLGSIPRTELLRLLQSARGLVFSSRAPEGLSTVCLEAVAAGTPILTWEPTLAASTVSSLGIGHVGSGDIGSDVTEAAATFPDLRTRCRAVFEMEFAERRWVERIEGVYALATRQSPGGR